jgi:hypothetical protein
MDQLTKAKVEFARAVIRFVLAKRQFLAAARPGELAEQRAKEKGIEQSDSDG